jgi:uncharacterized protein YggE
MTSPEQHRGPRPARVEVTGSGSASATPDVVRVALGIRCDSEGVAAALSAAAATVRKVSAAARAHGLADRDISSTSASVQPRWTNEGVTDGYTAYHQLTLLVRQLTDLNDLVDAVADAAGNSLVVDGITLDLADRAPLATQAREAAFADAQAKAAQYAALAGARLGRVLAVVEGGGGEIDPTPAAMGTRMMMKESGGGLPVEAGEHSVGASVRVAWQLVSAEPAE